MKPTPTHNATLLWMHSFILILNFICFILNCFSHNALVAICNFLVLVSFSVISMSNFQKFWHYRTEMKTYKIEQKELELKRLEAAFAAELQAQKTKELQEKFSYF